MERERCRERGKEGVGGMGRGGSIEWILKICVSWIKLA
jgi:hypothetical protein